MRLSLALLGTGIARTTSLVNWFYTFPGTHRKLVACYGEAPLAGTYDSNQGPEVVSTETTQTLEECIECDRLFQDYAASIHVHLEAVRRSHSAADRSNRAALSESERLENLALQQRQKVRRTLMEHEINHLIRELTLRQQVCE